MAARASSSNPASSGGASSPSPTSKKQAYFAAHSEARGGGRRQLAYTSARAPTRDCACASLQPRGQYARLRTGTHPREGAPPCAGSTSARTCAAPAQWLASASTSAQPRNRTTLPSGVGTSASARTPSRLRQSAAVMGVQYMTPQPCSGTVRTTRVVRARTSAWHDHSSARAHTARTAGDRMAAGPRRAPPRLRRSGRQGRRSGRRGSV